MLCGVSSSHLSSELFCLLGEFEGHWDVGVGQGGQLGLAGEAAGAREVVDAVVGLQLLAEGRRERLEGVVVRPHHVPIPWPSLYVVSKTTECGDHMMQRAVL